MTPRWGRAAPTPTRSCLATILVLPGSDEPAGEPTGGWAGSALKEIDEFVSSPCRLHEAMEVQLHAPAWRVPETIHVYP